MGTFSKALGSAGGYVACSRTVRDYLLNACGGFIFSTAPSPATVGAMDAAWDLVPKLSHERTMLQETAVWLRSELAGLGYDTGGSRSQIVPVIVGGADHALALSAFMMEREIYAPCIRPQAVPPRTSRLRLSLNTGHTRPDLERLLEALAHWKQRS